MTTTENSVTLTSLERFFKNYDRFEGSFGVSARRRNQRSLIKGLDWIFKYYIIKQALGLTC